MAVKEETIKSNLVDNKTVSKRDIADHESFIQGLKEPLVPQLLSI